MSSHSHEPFDAATATPEAETIGGDNIDNPNHGKDNATEPDITDSESEFRRDTDAGVERLAQAAERNKTALATAKEGQAPAKEPETPIANRQPAAGNGFAPKTKQELDQEANSMNERFKLMTNQASEEEQAELCAALHSIFKLASVLGNDQVASFALGDLAYSAQRNFVSSSRWLERGQEYIYAIATGNFKDAEERMIGAQERLNGNLQQISYSCTLMNCLLTVWSELALPDAVPILRDWQAIVNGVERQEQNRGNQQREVKDDRMKAALAGTNAMMTAMGIVPAHQQ